MPKTKKQLVFQAFKNLDINLLEVVLDEDKAYNAAPKSTFIEKVKVAFEEFKKRGDTRLTPYSGTCRNSLCENYGEPGFAFIGNHSNSILSFLFETTDEEVKDMAYCGSFHTDRENDESRPTISIHVYKDEEANFSPSPELQIKQQKSLKALAELERFKGKTITHSMIAPWIAEYQKLYGKYKYPILSFSILADFRTMYYKFLQFYKQPELELVSEKALNDYDWIADGSEKHLLKWLLKYKESWEECDDLCRAIGGIVKDDPEDDSSAYIRDFKVVKKNYEHIDRFGSIYGSWYFEMLEKYDTADFDDHGEGWDIRLYDLGYHLKRRGIDLDDDEVPF